MRSWGPGQGGFLPVGFRVCRDPRPPLASSGPGSESSDGLGSLLRFVLAELQPGLLDNRIRRVTREDLLLRSNRGCWSQCGQSSFLDTLGSERGTVLRGQDCF